MTELPIERKQTMPKTIIRPKRLRNGSNLSGPVTRSKDLLFTGCLLASRTSADIVSEANLVIDELEEILVQAGGTLDDVVSIFSLHLDLLTIDQVIETAARRFGKTPPAWTAAGTTGFGIAGTTLGLRVIADLSPGPRRTYQLPGRTGWRTGAASGKGSLLFVSGQTAEAVDGSVPRPTSHIKQARLAYQNMGALLEQAGGSFADVLDFTSFHLDIRGAEPTFAEVYVPEVMGKVPVDIAATTSHVGSSGLQRPGVLAAYSAIADMRAGARTGSTPDSVWWKDSLPIAAATRKSGSPFISLAGHVAAQPDGSAIHAGDALGQLHYIIDSMRDTLHGYGLDLENLVELTAFAKEPRAHETIRKLIADYLPGDYHPALSIIGVPGLWLEGFELEVAGIAIDG
jgi:enamine deaminase RidA (YjgF/YER057c/UK114 family)